MEFDIEKFDALRDYLTAPGYAKWGDTVSFRNLRAGVSALLNQEFDGHNEFATESLSLLRRDCWR